MNKSQKHYVKPRKPETKKLTLYDSIMIPLRSGKKKISEDKN